jgi:hypothetical protein
MRRWPMCTAMRRRPDRLLRGFLELSEKLFVLITELLIFDKCEVAYGKFNSI